MRFALLMFTSLALAALFCGCNITNERLTVKQGIFDTKYAQIKQICVEEAANYGFPQLDSEVKPSQYNDWSGSLYFSLKTGDGVDQLNVRFSKGQDGVEIHLDGAGMRANPQAAAKAIAARISQL